MSGHDWRAWEATRRTDSTEVRRAVRRAYRRRELRSAWRGGWPYLAGTAIFWVVVLWLMGWPGE